MISGEDVRYYQRISIPQEGAEWGAKLKTNEQRRAVGRGDGGASTSLRLVGQKA